MWLEYHSATLLPNGKVLVVGGASLPGGTTGSGVAVAELYEPDATNGPNPARKGKATDTGSLSVPRNQHYAMVSPSNSNYVLILGGFVGGDGGDSTLTEEAYNITTGQFEIIQPTPTTKRGGGTLMYLGGLRWLNAGGLNHDTNMVLSSAEIVDGNANGGSGAIIPTGSMPISTCLSSSVLLLDGRVFVCGGFSDLNTMAGVASAVVFNPTANGGVGAFTETQNTMSSPRWNHTATLLANGKVLVVGGQTTNDQSAVASADLYN